MKKKYSMYLHVLLALILFGGAAELRGQMVIDMENRSAQKPVAPPESRRTLYMKRMLYVTFADCVIPTVTKDARGIAMTGIADVDSINVFYGCKAISKRYNGNTPNKEQDPEQCYILRFPAEIDVETARVIYMETGKFTTVTVIKLTPMSPSK
jgi:hypothetical protein